MYGVCATCGKPVSTKETQRCKECYRRNVQEQNINRDKTIVQLIISKERTAAAIAREYNLSREAVRLILKKNGVDYTSIWRERVNAKKLAKQEDSKQTRNRLCAWCQKSFDMNEDGASVKYCSPDCKKLRQRQLQRDRIREYYKTPEGKSAQRAYAQENKEKIKKYFREWLGRKQASTDPFPQ